MVAPWTASGRFHSQAVGLGFGPACAIGSEPDYDIDAAVLEVQCMGTALAAVAKDRDLLATEA